MWSVSQAQTADLKTTAQQTKGKVEQVEQEELEIKTKLSGLNSIFKKASPDSVKSLKVHTQHSTSQQRLKVYYIAQGLETQEQAPWHGKTLLTEIKV